MKKIISLILVVLMVLGVLTGCSGEKKPEPEKKLKIGVILVGDENEGYTYAHIEGIRDAIKANGLSDDQVIWKYSVPDTDNSAQDAAVDLVEQGCTAIFSNSYGHQAYMQLVAKEYPNDEKTTIDFCSRSRTTNFRMFKAN